MDRAPEHPGVDVTPATSPRSRILGCLLAGAIGDALGAPIEFDSWAEIRSRFGPQGLTGYAPAYGRRGAITDDTQMTLFTAEGLLRAKACGLAIGHPAVPALVHQAYLRWLVTQEGPDSVPPASGDSPSGWLLAQGVLHAPRAPGSTCLSALRRGIAGTPEAPLNDSKGCGGVMRVAPVGLVSQGREAFRLGVACAAITHGHPTGYLAAGAFALVIAELRRGRDLPQALRTATSELARWPGHEETIRAIEAAVALVSRATPGPEDLEALGGGWTAEEALAIGLCCALSAEDVPHGLALAVNHGGDSDSTGSIAGNLLGARNGVEALPTELLEPLEAREVIERVGHDLADVFVEGRDPPADRYPPQ